MDSCLSSDDGYTLGLDSIKVLYLCGSVTSWISRSMPPPTGSSPVRRGSAPEAKPNFTIDVSDQASTFEWGPRLCVA